MRRFWKLLILLLCVAALLSGCNLRTVDQLYCLPKRSDAENDLQSVIDEAMDDLSYSAPIYGENRQVTQKVDLDGDGVEECLVFAKDDSEKPLKILIFCQLASGYVLMDTIEGYGFAFDSVEFAQIDGHPGLEIVVSRQVSNELMRAVAVYRFASEHSRQLMIGSCAKLLTNDFDKDGISELVLLSSGETEDSNGVLSLYTMQDDELQRTAMIQISQSAHQVKRAQISQLTDGKTGLLLSGITDDGSMSSEVFTIDKDGLKSLWKSDPVQSLDGYNVFPEDLDMDGIWEFPSLIPMSVHPQHQRQHYFVRWYSIDAEGEKTDKRCTYINYPQGWYLSLDPVQTNQLMMVANREACTIYADNDALDPLKLLTIYALTDSDRESIAMQEGYTILYKSDSVIYAAFLEKDAAAYGFRTETLKNSFHVMRTELNTDEN